METSPRAPRCYIEYAYITREQVFVRAKKLSDYLLDGALTRRCTTRRNE